MSNITAETADERLARLAQDAVGAGSLDAIRRSINLAAGLDADYGITDQGRANDAQIIGSGDTTAIQNRIRQIFTNRNLPIDVPAGPTTPAPAAPQTDSASAFLQQTLAEYGLESLTDWAMSQLREGRSSDFILLELRNRPEFLQRFPAIQQRQQQGLTPISPAEYVAYERQAAQILRQFGLPAGFYDSPDDFTRFLTSDVSPAELYERVQQGYQQVATAAPEVRQAFAEFFGPGSDNALAAFFLDPERAAPVLKSMVTEAQIGGAARQQGIMADVTLAGRLREVGVTEEEARAGFADVRAMDPLFTELVGEGADFTALNEGVAAAFNLDPSARQRVRKRQQQRLASFAASGGAAAGQRGIAGLGSDQAVI